MTLNLTVYKEDGHTVDKVYTTDEFHLLTGMCEDVLEEVDIDKMLNNGVNEQELGKMVLSLVLKNRKRFKPIMQQVFYGLTDEEYERTEISEVGRNVMQILVYTITSLFGVMTTKKTQGVNGKKP